MFRFNVDLWQDYKFAWNNDGFLFQDPTGRTLSSEDVSSCLWRRPSFWQAAKWREIDDNSRQSTEAELYSIFRELSEWARARKKLRLIEPMAGRRVGRLAQMRVAKDFFAVPDWSVGWGYRRPEGKVMVKRFAPEPLGSQRDLFISVQSVDAERLSPSYPWLTQEIGKGDRDATVLFVNGVCFGFEMELTREELGVEDWRTLNLIESSRWRPWNLSNTLSDLISCFMKRLGLRFGRLDFLKTEEEVTFLEVNPNGQFAWLDDSVTFSLHQAVLTAALDPASTVMGDECVLEATS